jgi:hypothetical protein
MMIVNVRSSKVDQETQGNRRDDILAKDLPTTIVNLGSQSAQVVVCRRM